MLIVLWTSRLPQTVSVSGYQNTRSVCHSILLLPDSLAEMSPALRPLFTPGNVEEAKLRMSQFQIGRYCDVGGYTPLSFYFYPFIF